MADRLRIALVGYGQTAVLHSKLMAREGQELAWLVGPAPEKAAAFAQEYGYERHSTELSDALDDPTVDAVILCTPSPLHAAQTAACLDAGKHVLVEIPMAMSYAEGLALAETARRRDLTLMVAHTHRYQGAMTRVRELVSSGALAPHSILARYLMLRHSNVGSTGYARSWTDSLVWHHGQHSVDMVLWLLGVDEPGHVEVTSVSALPDAELGIPLDVSLTIRTDRDQIATVGLSYNSRIYIYDFVIMGRETTLAIEHGLLRDRDGVRYDNTDERRIPELDSRLAQDREFLAAVRERRPAAISADSVLPALEVLQKVQDAFDARPDRAATHPILRAPL